MTQQSVACCLWFAESVALIYLYTCTTLPPLCEVYCFLSQLPRPHFACWLSWFNALHFGWAGSLLSIFWLSMILALILAKLVPCYAVSLLTLDWALFIALVSVYISCVLHCVSAFHLSFSWERDVCRSCRRRGINSECSFWLVFIDTPHLLCHHSHSCHHLMSSVSTCLDDSERPGHQYL